jgi:peptidoglycan hydrolase-like protein with peptidoglycan-binding domain
MSRMNTWVWAVCCITLIPFTAFAASSVTLTKARFSPARYGDYGEHVRTIQATLNMVEHANLRTTGYFGPATRAAVVSFQKLVGIRATGAVYSKTIAALTVALDASLATEEIAAGGVKKQTSIPQ